MTCRRQSYGRPPRSSTPIPDWNTFTRPPPLPGLSNRHKTGFNFCAGRHVPTLRGLQSRGNNISATSTAAAAVAEPKKITASVSRYIRLRGGSWHSVYIHDTARLLQNNKIRQTQSRYYSDDAGYFIALIRWFSSVTTYYYRFHYYIASHILYLLRPNLTITALWTVFISVGGRQIMLVKLSISVIEPTVKPSTLRRGCRLSVRPSVTHLLWLNGAR